MCVFSTAVESRRKGIFIYCGLRSSRGSGGSSLRFKVFSIALGPIECPWSKSSRVEA
jgi:hypothetical protein